MQNEIMQIHDVISRQYLIKGTTGYLLIDTGLRHNYTNLANRFKKLGIPWSKLEMIIITHADVDHFGCLDLLMATCPKIITAASFLEAEAIRKGKASRPLQVTGIVKLLFSFLNPIFTAKPAEIRRILTPGEEIPYLGGLEVLDTRGHSPGHISLWSKTTRSLFCGDSIVITGKSLSPSRSVNTWDLNYAKSALDLQLDLKPDRIYAGHGAWVR